MRQCQSYDADESRDQLGPNQACTLFGAKSGSNIISGVDYIAAGYGLDVNDLWRRNLPVLIGFFLLFQLTQILVLEFVPVSPRQLNVPNWWLTVYQQYGLDLSINIFTKETEEIKQRNAELREKKLQRDEKAASRGNIHTPEKRRR